MNTNQTTLLNTYVRLSFPLRSIFYMVSPSETYYQNLNDVPDITGKVGVFEMSLKIVHFILVRKIMCFFFLQKATNVFFFFILLEYVINVNKFEKKHRGSLGDSVIK